MHLTPQLSNRISSLKTRPLLLSHSSSSLNLKPLSCNSPRTSLRTNLHLNHNKPSKPVYSNKVQPLKISSSSHRLNFNLKPSSRISDQCFSNNLKPTILFNTDSNNIHSNSVITLSNNCRYLHLLATINY